MRHENQRFAFFELKSIVDKRYQIDWEERYEC
jgi:hypothetical protein